MDEQDERAGRVEVEVRVPSSAFRVPSSEFRVPSSEGLLFLSLTLQIDCRRADQTFETLQEQTTTPAWFLEEVAFFRMSRRVCDLRGRLSGLRLLGVELRHGGGEGDAAALDGL